MKNKEITLILPDIHNKVDRADFIIRSVGADKIICLGDVFDDFNDTVNDAQKSAYWLKKRLNQENFILLKNNHDLGYEYPNNPYAECSGFTRFKSIAINDILTKEDWNKSKWYHFQDGYFFSHAGLNYSFVNNLEVKQIEGFLEKEAEKAD